MQHAILYIALVLIAAFVALSKTFSPVWLLVIVLAMLWPEKMKPRTRPVFLLTILLLALYVFFNHFTLLAPFIVGLGLAYVLAPLVNVLERKKIPRVCAILMILIPVIALLPLILYLVISGLIDEMQRLVTLMPGLIQQAQTFFRSALTRVSEVGIAIDPNILADTVTNYLQKLVTGIFATIGQITKGIGSLILFIYNIIIIPLSAYLFLTDRDRIMNWFRGLFPAKEARRIDGFIERLNVSLAGFFRGQLTLMLIVGSLIGFGLWILGIRYYLLLGLIAGVCNLVPNIGYVVSLIPALLIGASSPDPLVSLLKIGAVYALEQTAENLFLGPVIIGRASMLHPIVVMIALIVGAAAFGIWGVMLAIPLVIFAREFMRHFLDVNV